jgi:hypothetical protein
VAITGQGAATSSLSAAKSAHEKILAEAGWKPENTPNKAARTATADTDSTYLFLASRVVPAAFKPDEVCWGACQRWCMHACMHVVSSISLVVAQ